MNSAKEGARPAARILSAQGKGLFKTGSAKPRLSISLDLDNWWTYKKTHGDPGWESLPSYLDTLAEIVLEHLKKHGLTITFFVVGQDASLEKNHPALKAIADAGHEIANHSFHHEPWLHLYSLQQLEDEISLAELQIERATGKRPRGFRGPGFSLSAQTLKVLAQRNYLYDATTFPTFLGPLARAYYLWNTRELSQEERKKRKKLFGSVRDGLRPLRPYLWELPERIVEIPVTTLPFLRVPLHLSYLVFLARFSRRLCMAYLRSAMTICRLSGVEPSFLLHPLDFLGSDKVEGLSFFPGMNLKTEYKVQLFDEIMGYLKSRFFPITMAEHAQSVLDAGTGSRRMVE